MLISCLTDILSNVTTIISYMVIRNPNFKYWNTTALCRLFSYIVYTSYSISIMNLSLIAIYRYICIVRPFSSLYINYKKQFIIVSEIFIWIVSLTLGIPDLSYVKGRIHHIIFCDYSYINTSLSIYLMFYVGVHYILPSSLIVALYWRIVVHQRNHIRPGQPSIQQKRHANNKVRLIKALAIISACYILTTWPYFAVLCGIALTQNRYIEILMDNQTNYWLSLLSISTTAIIAIINPFLCLKFDENIQRGYKIRFLPKLFRLTQIEVIVNKKNPISPV